MDIRPTIAVTKAHILIVELMENIRNGTIKVDNKLVLESGKVVVTKVAIDPVWWLPGIAQRFNISEQTLRQALHTQTNGMYPELVTRPELDVFLPPIGSMSVYIFGDIAHLSDPTKKLTVRTHDECNGSDVFGSDICTCRPYLTHGI